MRTAAEKSAPEGRTVFADLRIPDQRAGFRFQQTERRGHAVNLSISYARLSVFLNRAKKDPLNGQLLAQFDDLLGGKILAGRYFQHPQSLENFTLINKNEFVVFQNSRHEDGLHAGRRLRVLTEIPERKDRHSIDKAEINVGMNIFCGTGRTRRKL